MSSFPDPTYEAVAALHKLQNEFTEKSNRTKNIGDAMASSVVGIAICNVMISLQEIMPEAEYSDLHRRVHREVPLAMHRI